MAAEYEDQFYLKMTYLDIMLALPVAPSSSC